MRKNHILSVVVFFFDVVDKLLFFMASSFSWPTVQPFHWRETFGRTGQQSFQGFMLNLDLTPTPN